MSVLDSKDTRHEYMGQRLRMEIAFQVRLLRLQRQWTQEELGRRCDMEQSNISNIENWDKPFPLIDTLRRVANAFDCALKVSFENWEAVIASIIEPREDDLAEPKERSDE